MTENEEGQKSLLTGVTMLTADVVAGIVMTGSEGACDLWRVGDAHGQIKEINTWLSKQNTSTG